MGIAPHQIPIIHPGVTLQSTERGLIVEGPDGLFFTFEDEDGGQSSVAQRILELTDGRRSIAEIAGALEGGPAEEREQVEVMAIRFVDRLIAHGVLQIRSTPA